MGKKTIDFFTRGDAFRGTKSMAGRERGKNQKRLKFIQYDGSKDNLDWRIDFKYLNFI